MGCCTSEKKKKIDFKNKNKNNKATKVNIEKDNKLLNKKLQKENNDVKMKKTKNLNEKKNSFIKSYKDNIKKEKKDVNKENSEEESEETIKLEEINVLYTEKNKEEDDITIYEIDDSFSEIKNYGTILNQNKIDKILKNAPKRETISLNEFEDYLKKNTKDLSQKEKAYLIFVWISYNITYDDKGLKNRTVDRTAEGSYLKGTTVCGGYAKLFEHIGKALGLNIEYISGYSKGADYDPEHFNSENTHAWNIVILEGKKFLVDCTWGAGTVNDGVYKQNFEPFYFLTPPDIFLLSHFPDNKENQLMGKKNIDLSTFLENVKFSSDFFNLKFINCNCRKQIYHIKKNNKIFKFKHNNKEKIYFMAKLTKIDKNAWVSKIKKNKKNVNATEEDEMTYINGEEIEYSTYIQEIGNEFIIDVLFNKKGKYIIEFFAKIKNMEKYSGIAEFIIYCNQDAKDIKYYPKHFGNEIFDIISPNLKTEVIEYGKTYDFKIKSTEHEFYILQTDVEEKNKSFFKLLKTDDYFYDEKLFIYNDIVRFCYYDKKTNTYSTTYQFKVVKNNNNKITFPKVYSEKYTKLYEPITEELILGTKINFKIKVLDVQKMFIIQGDSFFEMEKIGDIYEYNDMYIFNKKIMLSYLNEKGSYTCLLRFKGIENPKKKNISYPLCFPIKKSRVIFPNYNNLLKGTFINFKCQAFDVDKLYIGQDNGFIEMDKIGKNIFELKNMYIYSNKINISFLKKNVFHTILQYKGIDNPSINNREITYPQVWTNKKCRLIKPIKGKLYLGSHVDFEVKVYDTQKMSVIQNDNFFEMDKKSEHTYQYKDMYIYSNSIKLAYYEPAQNTNYSLFKFKGVKNSNQKDEISFPSYNSQIKAKLISPLSGKLKRNSIINFNIKTCETDELKVIVGNKWNSLTKEGDNFIGKILIDANEVGIYYPNKEKPGNYKELYQFEVIR